MLKASYKVNILVFDPFLPDDKALKMGVKKVSLNKLFLIVQLYQIILQITNRLKECLITAVLA
jgi:hypothetical protein